MTSKRSEIQTKNKTTLKQKIIKKINEEKAKIILKDIKSLKIHGAENVAKAGIKAYLLNPEKSNAKKIISSRITEPLLQNAIEILLKSKNKEKSAKIFLNELETSHEKISKYGSSLIKSDINIYSHCHSSSVIDILIYAKSKKKRFVVYTTEVEPRLQGRITAKKLEKHGIKIIVAPDLALEHILRNCNIIFVGSDAFSNRHFYNKIGTSIISKLAKEYNIPIYACGVSLKYKKSIKLEKRSGKEVWDERKKNIEVLYPAFDKINYKLITGVISEFGILKPKQFIKLAKEKLNKIKKEI
jgi:translation initiation factor 2B subunit (eIF-2B alpha/beta/delta family)